MSVITQTKDETPAHLRARPRYRGWMHAAGAFAVVPAGALLIAAASSPRARLAATIYAAAQLAVFATSALYHLAARTPTARRRMQMADHVMIYVLIAGTWVPVCLMVLPSEWGSRFLAGVAGIALLGIALKSFGIDRFPKSSNALYLVMGWIAVLALPSIVSHIDLSALVLLGAGGIAYTVGSVILMTRRPDPRPKVFGYHEVWHTFTVVAAACHFTMVWIVVTA